MKTVGFADAKYVGDPVNAVRIFNEKEVDELIVLDIDATTQKREPNYELIRHLASESWMPLCYGGGVSTVEQARTIIGLGVEKVAISSAAIGNPGLVGQLAESLGTQSVVVVLDVSRSSDGQYDVRTHNGRVRAEVDLAAFSAHMEDLGAGEIVVNSIDNDGRMAGYDMRAARVVRESTGLPMTVLGGAGSFSHVRELVSSFGVVGAAAGSMFVFKGPYRAVLISYPSFDERDLLLHDALTTDSD